MNKKDLEFLETIKNNSSITHENDEENDIQQFIDIVDLQADGLIDSNNIISIKLPKVIIKMVNGKPCIEKNNLMLALHDNPKVCSNLLLAANNGLNSFKLTTYLDIEKTNICDTWELVNARIIGIDFGEIVTVPQTEQRIIQCEIEFDKLLINGVKI